MTLIVGWYDWATRIPGPAQKQYDTPNVAHGWALHSAEGTRSGILATLANPERQASWCGTLCRDGELLQHYSTYASCWASGNRRANTTLVGWELEGFASEPATGAQVATLLRMRDDWVATGRPYLQRDNTRTLWEHSEVATWIEPNAGPTACPSGRYAPFYAALEEDEMTPDLEMALVAMLGADWRGRAQTLVLGTADNPGTLQSPAFGSLEQRQSALEGAEPAASLRRALDAHEATPHGCGGH
ncbi:MAG: N-acetylmuramoyl-L-alanine amidase [SAR202 cluster bacterium]|nr:N-acetylmuramoyl-L-alanine amidase [SAR202 cluster bacterium]